MLDSSIHDLAQQISKMQEHQRMLRDCQLDLKNYGLEGMDFYHMSEEFEYMHDKDNKYFDIFRKSYSEGY